MGQIYKHPNPPSRTPQPVMSINTNSHSVIEEFVLPTARIIPIEKFTQVLNTAVQMIEEENFLGALPLLLNLEITDFENLRVHELLADVFLHINQLSLAKEQCQIYAQLLQKDTDASIIQLKSFDELLTEAGDFNALQKEFKVYQENEVSLSNFHDGTRIALQLATHYISQKEFKQAENLLVEYRNRYLSFLKKEEKQQSI